MRAPRVLHVTDYASPYEGAFIRQLRMLDGVIRARGGRPSVLGLTPAAFVQPWARLLEREGWQLVVLPPGASRSQGRVARAIAAAAEQHEVDVVHSHFGTYDLSVRRAVRMLRRRSGSRPVRLVWHYRTALPCPVADRSVARRCKDWLKFRRAGRDVDLFVAVTAALAREVELRGADGARCRGIIAGCDTGTFRASEALREQLRGELGLAPDDVLVLHMGWSWHRKGGDLLTEALRQIDGAVRTRIVAVSIGAPPEHASAYVRRVAFTPDVLPWHAASDIFVSASRSEGFGNGLVEAMSCERVAIATLAQGQVETFAGVEGVVACPMEDPHAIAAALVNLIATRSTWGQRGAANRSHVVAHHSMSRWAAEMADAYEGLLPVQVGLHAHADRQGSSEEVA